MDIHRFQGFDIVLVCGLPGSGKSHFARTHFLQSGRKRVNRKEIRRLLFEMTTFGQKWSEKEFASNDEFLVKHVERKIIEHLLQAKQKLLIDNTNISTESRKQYLTIAH
jgi:predicted kinase